MELELERLQRRFDFDLSDARNADVHFVGVFPMITGDTSPYVRQAIFSNTMAVMDKVERWNEESGEIVLRRVYVDVYTKVDLRDGRG